MASQVVGGPKLLDDKSIPQNINLQQIHDDLIAIAKKGGEMMLQARAKMSISTCGSMVMATGSKQNSADLVTETDKAVEDMVVKTLKTKYPDFEFLGEETYDPGKKLTDAPTFICDPVDGTTNFVHGFPNFCISLAFTLYSTPYVGVIYQPSLNNIYTAIKGRGSYLNLTYRLPLISPPPPLGPLCRSLCAVEWGADRAGPNWDCKFKTFCKLACDPSIGGKIVHSLRSLGSAALNFCAVAKGEVDCYWEGGCWAWDVAAGWVILYEAGGRVVDANPGNWEMGVDGRRYFAVRGGSAGEKGKIEQEELIKEFWDAVVGRYDYGL